jgi:chemotaxis protein methyltransferase CheR
MTAATARDERQTTAAEICADEVKEFRLSDRDFQYLRQLVSRETGIVITDAKRQMVYSRLARRLRALNLRDFRDYCRLLEEDAEGELNAFINAITTNLTSFFREPHHFTYLQDVVVPELVRKNAASRRIRIWSAGCSTGEEAYSIAIAMAEVLPPDAGWDWRILATDIDTDVLAKAQCGMYSLERVACIPQARLQRWFLRGSGVNQGMVRVCSELRDLISFKRLNLMGSWPVRGPIDVQFCRNVVIYFDKNDQRRMFDKFADRMPDDSCLFIGHSESLFKVTDRFGLMGQTIYRKRR